MIRSCMNQTPASCKVAAVAVTGMVQVEELWFMQGLVAQIEHVTFPAWSVRTNVVYNYTLNVAAW